jgi:aerobic C4-dicarboxylate transport protein
MKKVVSHLSFQVLIAIVLGVLFGVYFKDYASSAKLLSQTFINMITMLIAPIIFFTIVLGIASMNDMHKVGRVGGKALLYFEVITTFAIIIGLVVANIFKPGVGVNMAAADINKVLFAMMKFVMMLAPLGAFGGIAFTVGTYGIESLLPMGKLMLAVYITMALFIFVVLNLVCRLYKFSLWSYLKFIRQEILIVLGTSSSESVLPSMMSKMEQFGCSKPVVGLVIPMGYSFNLDGTSIYLSMAVIFLAQVYGIEMTLGTQITIIGVLMLTSKGAAAVTGGGFIVLASTLTALKIIPVEGMAILLGVDRFMSEARAITNMIGNGIASVVIAKSEKEFDELKYQNAISAQYDDKVN